MPVIGHGAEICTSTTRPSSPAVGSVIYQTDTDEYLKYVNYGGANRWMQADIKSGRRLNINGDLSVWQRGTSISNPTPSAAYGPDRWETYRGGYQTGLTISRQTGTGQFTYAARVQRNSGNTATEFIFFNQPIETVDSIKCAGKPITLSFWARAGANYSSNLNNRLIAQVSTGTGTDQNFRGGFTGAAVPAYVEQPLTTSWTFYSVSGVCAANITQIGVQFYYVPSGTAGANDWFEITGVQVEIGSAPSEFEFLPYGDELARCQRYFNKWGGKGAYQSFGAGIAYGLGGAYIIINTPTAMRAKPTPTLSSCELSDLDAYATAAINPSVGDESWENVVILNVGGLAGTLTKYRTYYLRASNSTSAYLWLSAEL